MMYFFHLATSRWRKNHAILKMFRNFGFKVNHPYLFFTNQVIVWQVLGPGFGVWQSQVTAEFDEYQRIVSAAEAKRVGPCLVVSFSAGLYLFQKIEICMDFFKLFWNHFCSQEMFSQDSQYSICVQFFSVLELSIREKVCLAVDTNEFSKKSYKFLDSQYQPISFLLPFA